MSNVTPIAQAYAAAPQATLTHPDPIPLPISLPDVPTFDRDLLPSQLGPWVEDIAERLNVPLDFAAMPAMVGAASLIGSKVGVRPQVHTSWTEAANLWGCIAGNPGMLKSPAVGEVFAPLRRLDMQADRAYQAELSHFEDSALVHKMALEEAQKRARKAVRDGECELAQSILGEVQSSEPPAAKRYLITDATVEKLGEITADNPEGIMFFRDELLTLLSDLEAPDKAVARGFFLTGWNGQDYYAFDRIGRGTIRIPRVNLSVFGTTQPTRIASYVRRALTDKNDGMCQRLQLFAWPDVTSEWRNLDRHPHVEARQNAYSCFDQLAQLDPGRSDFARDPFDDGEGMPFLRFSPGGVEQFVEYRTNLERAVRSDELPPGLADHLSKFRGLIPRLALILHLTSQGVGHVSEQAVACAIKWAGFLEGHARRMYGSLSVDNGEIARAILKRIDKGDIPTTFTERDIYGRHWANLPKGERLSQGLKMLTEFDWLSAETKATGGRPTTVYQVNPKAIGRAAIAA